MFNVGPSVLEIILTMPPIIFIKGLITAIVNLNTGTTNAITKSLMDINAVLKESNAWSFNNSSANLFPTPAMSCFNFPNFVAKSSLCLAIASCSATAFSLPSTSN